MLREFFGNLIFAIIARMLCGNRLNIENDFNILALWCRMGGKRYEKGA